MGANHVGFIMDGNGRWATAHGLSRAEGYAYGLIALRKVAKRCEERGVKAVSVYAFSTENIARPTDEINAIFGVVEKFNLTYDGRFKICYMGDFSTLPDKLADSIESVEQRTADNEGMTLNIAFNYGGRADIIHAAKIAYDHGEFIEDTFEKNLGSSRLPALDMIVRTGGEKRLSNFMLYEAAYAELFFLDKLWPDMQESDVDALLEDFEKRTRKFGK
ncbi:MAG: di-trans,poly-cis-decaprenylcistransferase [Clostridia bacterium]|nr:di-trans,poly-cis-decaprenylcistransferase [Clostridia bacterium]